MPDNAASSTNIGLSEFLSGIVSDTLDSILMARQQQESRYEDLLNAVQLTSQEFAKLIPDEAVEAALAKYFPTQEPNRSHAIYVNAPYVPPVGSQVETPPILNKLGVQLKLKTGATPLNGRTELKAGRLTQHHVEEIFGAVRVKVAATQQAKLSRLLAENRVGVIVDSGRLTAKVGLKLVPAGTPISRSQPKPGSRVAEPNTVSAFLRQPEKFRLELQMVDASSPQNQKMSVDVYSEIEITFKTVTT